MDNGLEKIHNLLEILLNATAPILSGNTKSGIRVNKVSDKEIVLEIDAPNYDINVWRKTGAIIPKKGKDGLNNNYASLVNNLGGFAKGGKSKHWVNRACFQAASTVAAELGATVVNSLPLD